AHGADPNARDNNGRTALHWLVAAANNRKLTEQADLLIKAAADINALDKDGRTPLSLIVNSGYKTAQDLAAFLLKHGALKTVPDFSSLRVSRGDSVITVFQQDTNHMNHFT